MIVTHRVKGRGFTMIEVLIALVVIGLGFVGLLALLSTSLKSSSTIVEDSFAATLARSVYEGLRQCAHSRGFIVKDGTKFVKGFVFVHDGVLEKADDPSSEKKPPLIPQGYDLTFQDNQTRFDVLRASDFTIFVPDVPNAGGTGPTAGEKLFVYPRPGGAGNDNGVLNGGSNDCPGITNLMPGVPGYQGQMVYIDVKRTYSLKNGRSITSALNAVSTEVADQYSFAILVTRSFEPPLVNIAADPTGKTGFDWANGQFPPRGAVATDGLYQVEVLVYRNFEVDPQSRFHDPVRGGRLVGLIALGP